MEREEKWTSSAWRCGALPSTERSLMSVLTPRLAAQAAERGADGVKDGCELRRAIPNTGSAVEFDGKEARFQAQYLGQRLPFDLGGSFKVLLPLIGELRWNPEHLGKFCG
jgi:hypothetical protein